MDIKLFTALAAEMNAHPERFTPYGDADCVAVLQMERDPTPFCVRLVFDGVQCIGVDEIDPRDATLADFRLVGSDQAWEAMFADITANQRATGLQTINSLALMGDDIRLVGDDPMGLDKFSRFNQTLQQFLDGAATVGAVNA